MSFIWLRLASVLQSWGDETPGYSVRSTGSMPTFSGVLGLLCSCLGISFRNDLEKVKKLRDSILIDIYIVSKGKHLSDFQGAGGGIISKRENKKNPLTEKEKYENRCLPKGASPRTGKIYSKDYLQDAKFDAVLRISDQEMAKTLIEKIQNPMWCPFLGRKANLLTEIPFGGAFFNDNELKEAWEKEGRKHTRTCLVHSTQDTLGSFPLKDFPLCLGDNCTTFRYALEKEV